MKSQATGLYMRTYEKFRLLTTYRMKSLRFKKILNFKIRIMTRGFQKLSS